jgi:hypothetical protein
MATFSFLSASACVTADALRLGGGARQRTRRLVAFLIGLGRKRQILGLRVRLVLAGRLQNVHQRHGLRSVGHNRGRNHTQRRHRHHQPVHEAAVSLLCTMQTGPNMRPVPPVSRLGLANRRGVALCLRA